MATLLRPVGLGFDSLEGVAEGADEDLAPVVGGDPALLDEGDGRHQGLYGTGVLA